VSLLPATTAFELLGRYVEWLEGEGESSWSEGLLGRLGRSPQFVQGLGLLPPQPNINNARETKKILTMNI
jgi:hypothetical protein